MKTPRLATTLLCLLASSASAIPPQDAGTPTEASLLEEGRRAREDGDHARAAKVLGRCVSLNPKNADCTLALAAAYASLGSETNQEADSTKALELYQRFLKLAPPDDPRVPRVRALLLGADEDFPPPGAPNVVTSTTPLPIEERLGLVVGERRVVKVANLVRVAVRNDTIVDITATGGGVEIAAMKPGTTTVLFRTATGQFTSTITVAPKR